MTKKPSPCPDVPGGCYCRCHRIGMARSVQGNVAWRAWKPWHDEFLKARVRAGDVAETIAAAISARFGTPRTPLAVRRRIKLLSLSTREGWWSRDDAIRLLGTSKRALKRWESDGLLSAPTEYGRWRRYRTPDLEAFIKQQAGRLLDPRRVRDPRLRSIAEVAATVNRRTA